MQEIDHTANPFPGLRPFESSETHLFFGRDGQSEELLRRLRRTRFLAVVGTSGSGKSSLVRAGLLPALQGGLMASAGSDWRIAILRPGGDPIGNLARALASPAVLGSDDDKGDDMQAVMAETTLRRSSLGLVELVSRARTKVDEGGQPVFPDYENLLIVVDQFEELFRFKQLIEEENSKEDAAAFVKLLLEAVGQENEKKIYVVLTMRSDFLGDCSQFFELPEAINNGQYLIPRMTRDERREAISGPVSVGQGAISEPLVNQLLNDVGDNPDQLPILQHALMRTWDHWLTHRNGNPIDIPDYNAIGGMAEALSRHADEAYAELNDAQKLIAEKLFKGLTEKGTDNREIRRPMEVQEICELTGADEAAVIAVIEVFRREGRSFLMPPPTDALTGAPVHLNRESLIDISHESLIRNWDRLKIWVDEESRSARIYRRLAETAVLHKEGGAGLWRDPDLGVALTWREQSNPNKVWAQRYHAEFPLAMNFLDESVNARNAQIAGEDARRRKEIRRTRLTALIFAVAFIFSLAMGVYAYTQKNRAETLLGIAAGSLKDAERQKTIAKGAQIEAERAKVRSDEDKTQADIDKASAQAAGRLAADRAVEANNQRQRAEQQAGIAKQAAIKADRELVTNQYFRQATAARQRGNNDAAETSFQQAFNGFRQLAHYDGMADTYVALGELLLEKNHLETESENSQLILFRTSPGRTQAVKYLDEAADFYSIVPDYRAAAETLIKAGESFFLVPYRRRDDPFPEEHEADLQRAREGVKRFEQALKKFELVQDRLRAIDMLKRISEFYDNFTDDADRRKALGAYEKLLQYQPDDRESLIIKAAHLSFFLKDPARADDYLGKAIKLHRDAAEVDEAVSILISAGAFLAGEAKDKERAGSYFERALKLCHEICKEKEDEAKMLISVGQQVDSLIGDERAAIGYFEQAAQIHRDRGDKAAEAQALTDISKSFEDRCKLGLETPAAQANPKAKCEMAIQYLKRALAIYRDAGDLTQQSKTVSSIANVYDELEETQLALETRESALALAPATDPSQRTSILREKLKAQIAASEYSQALATYKELLALQVQKGDEQEQANALKEIGDLQFKKLKQPQEAIASYQRALLLYDRSRGKLSFESVVQEALHRAYLETKRRNQ
jgi:tetratricopeptide (TPR) repeat protein